jgi:hypothetical protein
MRIARALRPITRSAGLAIVTLVAACQDSPNTTAPAVPSAFDISEARFGGGNPDLFFGSPLAANPSPSDPRYDAGDANGALRPYLRVCVTDGAASPAGCLSDVTAEVTGSATGLVMDFNSGNEFYSVGWRTDRLDRSKEYRIEIWGVAFSTPAERAALLGVTFPDGPLAGRPRWLFGWRDIDQSPSVSACKGDEPFCFINYGQTLPVKVRIEDFVLCPMTRNCAVQFVAAGVDANLSAVLAEGEAASSVQLFIPGQSGTNFTLGFEPCTAAEKATVQAYSALPTFGPCLKTVPPPTLAPVQLTEPALISYCLDFDDEAIEDQLAVPESQHDLVGLHHFSTGGNPTGPIVEVEAWTHATPVCGEPTSGELASAPPRGMLHRLADAGLKVLGSLGPQPLVALDRGGGGEGFDLESFYMLALPAKFGYELPADSYRVVPAGSNVTLRAKATDLNGDPVWGAKVGWAEISSPGGGANVPPPPFVPTGLDGIAQVTVTLSPTSGDNVFHANGLGIADSREVGCTEVGGAPGAASCNGPRATYDPFQPSAAAEFGGVLALPLGTRLPFTVHGCAAGRGTATVDGALVATEWGCARSLAFPVKLPDGSIVPARMFWMNDDARFYFALRVAGTATQNALRIEWDNDGDAPAGTPEGGTYATAREGGDDVWEVAPGVAVTDRFIDAGCSASEQPTCGSGDIEFGGANQTTAAFNNSQGGVTVYELSHPLATADKCANASATKLCGSVLGKSIDIGLAPSGRAGFSLVLLLGIRTAENVQWPGFLRYVNLTIQ